jgi:hypothetical protein
LPAELQRRLAAPLATVGTTMSEYLRMVAGALRTGKGTPAIRPVQAALEAYAEAVAAVRAEGLTRSVSGDVAERFFALGFCLEGMRKNLKDLERCVSNWCESSKIETKHPNDELF